jgi:hypothetical protein
MKSHTKAKDWKIGIRGGGEDWIIPISEDAKAALSSFLESYAFVSPDAYPFGGGYEVLALKNFKEGKAYKRIKVRLKKGVTE